MKNEIFGKAFESIEPENSAEKRMLENIEKKAEKSRGSRSFSKPAFVSAACLFTAACLCILCLPHLSYRHSHGGSPQLLAENETSAGLRGKRSGFSVILPERAEIVSSEMQSGAMVESFELDGQLYCLSVSDTKTDSDNFFDGAGALEIKNGDISGFLYTSCGGFRIAWQSDFNFFLLWSTSGASEKEICLVFEEISDKNAE